MKLMTSMEFRVLAASLAFASVAATQIKVFSSRDSLIKDAAWREVGPVHFSGRIVDIEVHPQDASTWYVASASGGLFRTSNRGLSFEAIFDSHATTSIGDIAFDPSDPKVLWIGTGEANNQRSSYWGSGVYKSVDAGKTWANVGLGDSHHIGRIIVDPSDGQRVFVAALGHLYSPNEERGLYRTTDGGKTWQRVLGLDGEAQKDVGVVDVAFQPGNSQVLLAATYERRRRAWHFDGQGPGSGLWRSEDGGTTWARVTALPGGEIGRIGIAFAASKPGVCYLTVENENPSKAPTQRVRTEGGDEAEAPDAQELAAPQGAARAQAPATVGGEVYRSDDAGKTWSKTNARPVGGAPAYYYGQIRVDPRDENKVWILSVPVHVSVDGGKTFRPNGAPTLHSDHHALWVDPADSGHLLLGNDGGLAESFDAGATWSHFENLPVVQFYAVGVDMADPYRIYGGTQDNGSWGMPSAGPTSKGLRIEDTFKVSGGDGFYVCVDPTDPNIVYSESQFGGLGRTDLRTMERKGIQPRPARGEAGYRFNWMSPILISPHNPRMIWFGGNKLFRSYDRGDTWKAVSDDLTTRDADKLAGNVPHCTITTISESPLRPGYVWVGTDDGLLWMTPDGGKTWRKLDHALPASAQGLWISRVEASHFDAGRCYVSVTGYREDRFEPLVFVTDDYGLSFRSIEGDLPRDEPVNVVREDPRNEDLLFVGTELGVYASTTRGGAWVRMGAKLPRVAVHDLVVHPREPEVVIATHGRGMFVADVSALEQWTETAAQAGPMVVQPRRVRRMPPGPTGGYTITPRRADVGAVASAVELSALLPEGAEKARLRVVDVTGTEVFGIALPKDAGLHVVRWDMRRGSGAERSGITEFVREIGRRTGQQRRPVPKGSYRVELVVDDANYVQRLDIVR